MRRQSSGVSSSNGMLLKMPALLTTASSRPKLSTAVVHDRLAALGAVDGVVRGHCRPARGGDLVDDLVGDGCVGAVAVHGSAEVVDDDGCAAARQLHRIEAPEPAPGAGDDRDLAVEVDHGPTPRFVDWRRVRTLRWNRYLVNERGAVETGSTTVDDDGPQRLGLLASALAGRTVAVASGGRGEPAWTDGITVFVDAAESPRRQLESVTVQASLLAGGGLEPDVVRKLVRRPALAKRYLAVEGHRALAANEDCCRIPCDR